MHRIRSAAILAAILILLLQLAACGDDPGAPQTPTAPPETEDGLDLAAILAAYAAGDLASYGAALHPEFRLVPPQAGAFAYAREQELELCESMHAGAAGLAGEVVGAMELRACTPLDDWIATRRDDPLGAHRPTALRRRFAVDLAVTLVQPATTWRIAGELTAYADSADGTLRLLGLADHGAPEGASGWSELRRAWAAPRPPELPGTPDLLSMRWIAAHDGRDWLRLGELLHPEFRFVDTGGGVHHRAAELALFADLMAGRPGRGEPARIAGLDATDWERTETAWNPVAPDDPHFGGIPGAVAQWIAIRIEYTTTGGELWLVDGLVRQVVVETPRGFQMLGFVDDSAATGEPGSLGWSEVRGRYW